MPAALPGYIEGSIRFRTEAFWQAVALRQRILRDPLGLALTVPEVLAEGPPMGHYGLSHLGDDENFGEVFACASYVPMGDDIWKIRQVAVDDSLQGQGFGRRLMLGLEEHLAFVDGATCFKVHARKSVQSFYEKLGYEVSGTTFEEVGLPHVLMIKRVPRHPLFRPVEDYQKAVLGN